MIKILILEDNRELASTLIKALKAKGRKIFWFSNIKSCCEFIEKQKVDLCILDRMLPDGDSLELIDYLVDLLPDCHYLFLTQQKKLLEKISCLEKGAIDYLTKPFSLAELRVKVKNILKLTQPQTHDQQFELGKINFFPEKGLLITPDGEINLRKKETELVLHLFRAAGSIVSKQALITKLWQPESETKINTIDVYIKRLRKKLGKYHSIIKTRRGFGYQLVIERNF